MWGAVCAARFNDAVAAVACRQLGKAGGIAHGFSYFGPPPDTTPHIMTFGMMSNTMRCSGFERSLTECRWDFAAGCGDPALVGLECSP